MSIPRTVEAKVADWQKAFFAVAYEITPQEIRNALAGMQSEKVDAGSLSSAERLARMVSANDRTAALVAAMLTTQGGVRPAFVDLEVE